MHHDLQFLLLPNHYKIFLFFFSSHDLDKRFATQPCETCLILAIYPKKT